MNALQLYKFIQEHSIEIDWRDDELMVWIDFYSLRDFADMINDSLDEGTEVALKQNCIAFDIVDLCEYYEIDPEEILAKPE
jgi:hypothetical protein